MLHAVAGMNGERVLLRVVVSYVKRVWKDRPIGMQIYSRVLALGTFPRATRASSESP